MPNDIEVLAQLEILFVVQGERQPKAQTVHPTITVAEFIKIAAGAAGIEEEVEVFLEDADEPLGGELILAEHLSAAFAPLHVARHRAKIAVRVEFNAQEIEREFRPNATIERVTRWAISPEGFNLEGDPSDFQMKHDGEVLPPGTHIGQVDHPHHRIKLDLVFKTKPQGHAG